MGKTELDFRNVGVGKLFTLQLIPALLGMVASALYVVADGILSDAELTAMPLQQ